MPLTTVYISDYRGRRYATNVEAETIEDAVRKALEFVRDPFWEGLKPKPGMILTVSPTGVVDAQVMIDD